MKIADNDHKVFMKPLESEELPDYDEMKEMHFSNVFEGMVGSLLYSLKGGLDQVYLQFVKGEDIEGLSKLENVQALWKIAFYDLKEFNEAAVHIPEEQLAPKHKLIKSMAKGCQRELYSRKRRMAKAKTLRAGVNLETVLIVKDFIAALWIVAADTTPDEARYDAFYKYIKDKTSFGKGTNQQWLSQDHRAKWLQENKKAGAASEVKSIVEGGKLVEEKTQ